MEAIDDLEHLARIEGSRLVQELAKQRKDLGLTMEELAERTGRNRMTIQRMEGEQTDPSLETFLLLAWALNRRVALVADSAEQPALAPEQLVHRGLAYARTRNDATEKAFAKFWEGHNKHQSFGMQPLMKYLVPNYDQDQATAAATVVQWMGTQEGMIFLREVLASVGKEIVDAPAKRR